jgi:hypothetical protein
MGDFSQVRQELWLHKDDLRDSSSWSSTPHMFLRDIHSKLIDQYDCKEVCAPSPSQVNTGARVRPISQDGVPPPQQVAPLSLPQFNRLFESSFAWDERSDSTAGVGVIPSQFKVTHQILTHWYPFRDLNLKFVGSCRTEKLSLCSQHLIVDTVEESVLRTQMPGLESQEEVVPRRVLFFKPMSWLGQIRTHRRDESWSASL